jgi:hypothetical protein
MKFMFLPISIASGLAAGQLSKTVFSWPGEEGPEPA